MKPYLFYLLLGINFLFSCNPKEVKNSPENPAFDNKDENPNKTENDSLTVVAVKIANSPTYIALDSLQGILNTEVRIAYDSYLINRKKNNTIEIIKVYQSNMKFNTKREVLKKLGFTLSPALDKLATEIEKTANNLSVEFPILNNKVISKTIIEKVLVIKPQSGLSNPLETR